jgi:uncharacterized protein (TIGR01244 family)
MVNVGRADNESLHVPRPWAERPGHPVVSGGIGERDVRRFAELIGILPGPVLGFCRSGARSAALWQAARPVPKAG